MRYSKGRIVFATIIGITCFALVVFIIYKGIDYAKRANNLGEPLKADVTKTEEKTIKKEEIQNKKIEKETEQSTTKTSDITNNTDEETKVKEDEVKKQDSDFNGVYVIKELKYQNRKYTKNEISKLIKEGYSMNLEIKDSEVAIVSVLSINHVYLIDGSSFTDGTSKTEYTYKNKTIKVTIDGAEMLFEKK